MFFQILGLMQFLLQLLQLLFVDKADFPFSSFRDQLFKFFKHFIKFMMFVRELTGMLMLMLLMFFGQQFNHSNVFGISDWHRHNGSTFHFFHGGEFLEEITKGHDFCIGSSVGQCYFSQGLDAYHSGRGWQNMSQ